MIVLILNRLAGQGVDSLYIRRGRLEAIQKARDLRLI